jgi:C-terminal processing protease CtpA/Prc
MLGELQNGHTLLMFPDGIGAPALRLEKIEGQAVVMSVRDVSESEAMGPSSGTVILAVDGIPVREALARVPAWLVAAASPRAREYESYRHLLYGRSGTTVRVLFQNEGGAPFLVELEREVIDIGYDDDSDEGEEDPIADEIYLPSEMTDDGIGYVRLLGFDGKPLVERFDEVMDELQDAKGIILDLRENRGGYLEAGLDVVGRFFPEAETIGKSCEAVRHADGRREEVCHVQIALPQQHVYRGPLAVLINQRTYSAGEIVAHALCDSGRARCFGTRTAGETDCVRRQFLPGAIVQRSVCEFRTESGQSLFGIGVTPHVEIEKTLDDVRSYRNPVREVAEAWLRSPEAEKIGTAP